MFSSFAVSCIYAIVLVLVICVWRVLNWLWLTPMKLEKRLREQGLKGNSYRLLFGDFKEIFTMTKEANSKPINLSDAVMPRVLPFFHKSLLKYGAFHKIDINLILSAIYIYFARSLSRHIITIVIYCFIN